MAEGRHTPSQAGSEYLPGQRPQLPTSAVREELARVLVSHEFRTSRRCQDFLRYVVETALDGRAGELKERTIGVDVFGRPDSYDPSDDATVRVKAGEVRKRLGLYYAGEGKLNEIRIELPGGAYVPDFRNSSSKSASVTSVTPTENPEIQKSRAPSFQNTKVLAWCTAALLAAGLALVLIYYLRPANRETNLISRFWEPVLEQSSTPVLLSAAYVPVYALNKVPGSGPPETAQDFTPLNDQFVGGGDLLAVVALGRMLDRMHRSWQVKVGTEASFSDIRNAPTVLVGYSYTRWREISKEMPYFIDAERRPLMILKYGIPTPWGLPNLKADLRTGEDYAIVSRVFNPDTRTLLVEIAGITQYGTTAAADLVTNPDLLQDALGSAPGGWEKKNLQLVLHTRVISGIAASQKVVASYYW